MPFYIRKTVKAGPFHFNLSSGGIGISVGVRGFRVGAGPRGHYVQAGRNGLYYRASLGKSRDTRRIVANKTNSSRRASTYKEQARVNMIDVHSDDVAGMRDANVSDLLDDLNARQAQIRLAILFPTCIAAIGMVTFIVGSSSNLPSVAIIGAFTLLFIAVLAWAIGAWLDSYKRRSVLFYNLDETAQSLYTSVTEKFDVLMACRGKWHIAAGGAIKDLTTWKRNAGAAYLINRKAANLTYDLPKVLRSNITPPAMIFGDRTLYFFPEILLVSHNGKFGAVGYDKLEIRWQTSKFIEESTPPSDAHVVGRTWKYPNKHGGPDRRFKNNYQLPICLYEAMHLSSESGVNELAEFSRTGVVQPFSSALHGLPRRQASSVNALITHVEAKNTIESSKERYNLL